MQIANNIHAFMWKSMSANNCNTYLIDGPTRILIDPGHRHLFDHVHKGLKNLNLAIEDIGLIICTHAHPDHMEAVQLFNKMPTMITLHHKEWHFLKTMDKQTRASIGLDVNSIAPDFFLKDGDVSVNGIDIKVFYTPGHSPGSICLYFPDQKILFSGDLLFKGGVGRTDLPGGNGSQLKDSIKSLTQLDIEWLLPGHGEIISGATEIKTNFDRVIESVLNYI